MEAIVTDRLVLRPFRESDYDDLYEFLSQLRDDEFEVFFRKDADGNPVWKDTYVYAMTEADTDRWRI